MFFFFFSSRRRHTRCGRDWSSDVCSSDLPPGSAMERAARDSGLRVAREGFIDRAYEPDGTLRSRSLAGALLTDPAAAAAQALSFVRDGGVRVGDGTFLPLAVETLCVHGDTPGAPEILRAARAALE